MQLITSACTKDVTLGSSTFSTSKTSYNEAVGTLNTEAGKYNNSTYSSRARCVGSHPTSTSDTTSYFTSSYSYMSSYNGQFKKGDTNYETDYEQMGTLGIRSSDNEYWLASRYANAGSNYSNFIVRQVMTSGALNYYYLCDVESSGITYANSMTYGLRPVFILKSGIKVTGGNGTAESPYTLGV